MASFSFQLDPVPPFRLDLTVWALRRRQENLIDRWDGGTYTRVLLPHDNPLEVAVSSVGSMGRPRLRVVVQGSRPSSRVRSEVREILTSMLGIQADLSAFYRMAERNRKLGLLASRFRGLKPPRFPTVFEALTNAIACQQLSLTVGILLLNRLSGACGRAGASGNRAFPGPSDVLRLGPEDMRRLGFSYAKARALLDLARAILSREMDLEGLSELNDDAVRETLIRLKGVGRWTAEYAMLRGLGRLSVFPGDDVGARNRLQAWFGLTAGVTYERVNRLLSRWKPFGGLVYFHLLLSGLAEKGLVRA